MDIRSTKTRAELEDDEARRLIRKAPKYKPPRRDRRRERDNSDHEVDPDEVADRKDRSENYKDVGGSMAQRVASRHLVAIEFDTKDEKEEYLEEHPGADPTKHTVKEEAEEGAAKEEDGGKRGKANQKILDLAKSNPRLKAQLKEWKHGDFYIPLVQSNPDFPVEKTAIGKYLPEELRGITVGELDKILSAPTSKKTKAEAPEKAEAPKAETPEAAVPEAPKVEAPEAEAPKVEAPEAEAEAPKAKAPKTKKKPKKGQPPEKGEEAPAAEATEPARPRPTQAQQLAAIRKIRTVFPEEFQADILKGFPYPEDVDALASYYQAMTSQPERDVGAFAAKVSKFFTTNPKTVGVPPAIASLPPDQQAEAYRNHQIRTVAISLAAKKQVSDVVKASLPKDPDPVLVESLAATMLNAPSTKREELSRMAADKLYDRSSQGTGSYIPQRQVKKILGVLGDNPDAQRVAVSYLQGNDLALAKQLFIAKGTTGWGSVKRGLGGLVGLAATPAKVIWNLLKSDDDEGGYSRGYDYERESGPQGITENFQPISEWNTPKAIGKGIQSGIDFIRKRGQQYPEVVSQDRDPGEAFKEMTLARVGVLAPAKVAPARVYLEQQEVKAYDQNLRDYENRLAEWETERDLHAHEEHRSEPVPPKRSQFDSDETFSQAVEAYQGLKSEREATISSWEQKNPKPPPPRKPARYDEIKNPKALKDMRKSLLAEQFAQYGDKTAAKVAAEYVISSYPTHRSMAALPEKTAIYHGVAPYKDAPQYAAWLQVHQRDIGEADLDTLLKSAREWLKTPVLDLPLEATPRDVQLRAALDLAIYDSHYNGQIQPNLYNTLLARLAGADENSTLLTQRTAKEATMKASNEIRKLAAKYAAENASLAYDLMDLASKVAQDEEQDQGQQKQAQDQQEQGQEQEKQASKYASLRSAVITAASKNPGAREAFIPVLQAIKSLG